jgi:Fic family protein
VRFNGDWEGWLRFFLRGVRDVATEAARTANKIVELREAARITLLSDAANAVGLNLLDRLFMRPITNVKSVAADLDVSFASANNLVANFCEKGLLTEITGGKRNRLFRFDQYLQLFEEIAPLIPTGELQETHY